MARLTIQLLGPFHVTLDGEPITGFESNKVRALLAYLVMEFHRPHSREALAGLLWPHQPERTARHNLRQALSNLRQVIGDREADPPFLRITRRTVQFNPDGDYRLDVARFEALIAASKGHAHSRLETCQPCIRRLEQALALYRGEFLTGLFVGDSLAFEEWALLRRERFHRLALDNLYHLANHYERRRDYDRARRYARRQVELEPWREEAHRQLMRLLARSGQRSTALAQYERCRRTLAQELGVEPDEETRSLYERIRAAGSPPPHNLPTQLTPFFGRKEELARIAERLADPACRLLTLVGPGGIGKTRLALQAAAEQVGGFLHGVFFVPLAATPSTGLLAATIAEAIGYPFSGEEAPQAQLLNYLRGKEMLLVMDGFEHLLPPAPPLGDGGAPPGKGELKLLIEILLAVLTCDETADLEQAQPLYAESLALARQVGDQIGEAKVLINQGASAHEMGDYAEARRLYRESLALYRALDYRRGVSAVLNNLGQIAGELGEYAAARDLIQESLDIKRETGNRSAMVHSLLELGNVARKMGEYQEASRRYSQALTLALEIQALHLAHDIIVGMAELLEQQGQPERALELLCFVQHRSTAGQTLTDRVNALLADLEAKLPAATVARCRRRGQSATLATVASDIPPRK